MQARVRGRAGEKENAPPTRRPSAAVPRHQGEPNRTMGPLTTFRPVLDSAVFLRTLVHSTGRAAHESGLSRQRRCRAPGLGWFRLRRAKGRLGYRGRSGWEFGVNEDVKTKAEGDFEKSVKAQSTEERDQTTFVFVTPRRWSGKGAWVAAAKAKGLWKDVRAYDASDLEQWLEQSLPAQAWFANETHVPAQDVRSLDKCWADWANVSTPPLTGALFRLGHRSDQAHHALAPLQAFRADRSMIAAELDRRGACLPRPAAWRARQATNWPHTATACWCSTSRASCRRLAEGAQTIHPGRCSRARSSANSRPYAKSMHSIVVYPRNAANTEPDIVLEPVELRDLQQGAGGDGQGPRRDLRGWRMSRPIADRFAPSAFRWFLRVRTPEWAADQTNGGKPCAVPVRGRMEQRKRDRQARPFAAGGRPPLRRT